MISRACGNPAFNAIRKNKILAKILEFTVLIAYTSIKVTGDFMSISRGRIPHRK